MTFQTQAIGVLRIENTVPGPQLIPLQVILTRSLQPLHPTVRDCLRFSCAAVSSVFGERYRIPHEEVGLQVPVAPTTLEGPSFGLAVFFSLASYLLDTGAREGIVYTGQVDETGRLLKVGDMEIKLGVRCDERYIVIPYDNDPGVALSASGMRIIRSRHLNDVLWLGLATPYLTEYLLPHSKAPWKDFSAYLQKCLDIGLLPGDLGDCFRKAYQNHRFYIALVDGHRIEYAALLIQFSQITDPNPDNLLQAIFCNLDWNAASQDETLLTHREVAGLFEALALGGKAAAARDLLNLFLLSSDPREILATQGPMLSAIKRVHKQLSTRMDEKALALLFGGRLGISFRLQSLTADSDLVKLLSGIALTTEVIHDGIPGDLSLGRFRYYFEGRPLDLEIEKPMALWDSSSSLPETFKRDDWKRHDDATFRHPEGQIVGANFGLQRFRLNRYDTDILWQDGLGCWPPSIDTLHFLADLSNHGIFLDERADSRVLDLCCGTGVLGMAVAKAGNVNDVSFLDLEPNACALTRINIAENFRSMSPWSLEKDRHQGVIYQSTVDPGGHGSKVFTVYQGEAVGTLSALKERSSSGNSLFRTIIFTPPYVPEPELLGLSLWRATGGTDLLEWVLRNGHRFAKRIVVSYSEIAQFAVDRALRTSGHVIGQKTLGEHWVALRIPGFLEAFELILDGVRKGKMSERAESYWNTYLGCLRETSSLASFKEVPADGHGFKWAHKVIALLVSYSNS